MASRETYSGAATDCDNGEVENFYISRLNRALIKRSLETDLTGASQNLCEENTILDIT